MLLVLLTSNYNHVLSDNLLSPAVYEQLQDIRESIEQEQYGSAAEQLVLLRKKSRLSPFEKAQVCHLSAYNHYIQDKLEQALDDFQCVLEQKNIPEELEFNTLKTMTQLLYEMEKYKEVQKHIDLIEQKHKLDNMLILLKGYNFYQLQHYSSAIVVIRPLVFSEQGHGGHESTRGNKPEQAWLTLLQACYHQLEDYHAMAEVLEIMVQYYPSLQHMTTLASVYSQIHAPKKHLALLESLWDSKWLESEAHIRNMVALQLQAGIPFKAASSLQQALDEGAVENTSKRWLELVQAWIAAREEGRAIELLERKLASYDRRLNKIVDDEAKDYADMCFLLGQLYFQKRQWAKSAIRLQQCIQQPSKKLHHSHLLLGISLANQNLFEQAMTYLQLAQRSDRFHNQAEQWLNYSKLEKVRLKQLE